jgi:hypothetical protein
MSESLSDPAEDGDPGRFGEDAGSLFAEAAKDEARRVEFELEDEVESSGISTTFQVCNVASGAKDTRRFAGKH